MHAMNYRKWFVLMTGMALISLVGCERAVAPDVAAAQEAVATSTPVAAALPPASPAVIPQQPSTEPAVQPVRTKSSASEPELATMSVAQPPAKLGAPVDLRYTVDGSITAGQPVTLHLAAVPRVAGSNLEVSIKEEAGISTSAKTGQARAQKADAAVAYRQQMSVTKQAGGPTALRVLVTMETPEGSSHSWFTVPLEAAPPAGKAVKATLE
jgi:hypothetical protein